MLFASIFIAVSFLLSSKKSDSVIVSPKDASVALYSIIAFPEEAVVVKQYQNISLPCIASTQSYAKWKHRSIETIHWNFINSRDLINNQYGERFELDPDCAKGQCTLSIIGVLSEDAGYYCCAAENGDGEERCITVDVIKDLVCSNDGQKDGVIVNNGCNIPPEQVLHKCNLIYTGHKPISVVWQDMGGNPIQDQGNTTIYGSHNIEFSLIREAVSSGSKRDGVICRAESTSVECVTDYSIQYAYNSTAIFSVTDGVVPCTANASGPCMYTWRRRDDDTIVFNGSVLNTANNSPGTYTCYANCSVKPSFCLIDAMTLVYKSSITHSSSSSSSSSSSNNALIGILLGVLLPVFVGVAAFLTWYFHKTRDADGDFSEITRIFESSSIPNN